MSFKTLLGLLFGVFLSVFHWQNACADEKESLSEKPIWLMQQEFVKLGKREFYEAQKKHWNQKCAKALTKKNSFESVAFQHSDALEYFYLTPLKNYAEIDKYLQFQKECESAFSEEEAWKRMKMMASVVHFDVNTLHEYRQSCSYPSQKDPSLLTLPYAHYFLFSLEPGSEGTFEQQVQMRVDKHKKMASSSCWRVWKVMFGSDLPKYLVCLFAKTKEELEAQVKQIEFLDVANKEIIRRQQEGEAFLREDLSMLQR